MRRAAEEIANHFSLLEQNPQIGVPLADENDLQELMIPFGDGGYVALYRYEETENSVYVLAFRHQREAGC